MQNIFNVPRNAAKFIVAYVDFFGDWWYMGDYKTEEAAQRVAKGWPERRGVFIASPTMWAQYKRVG